MTPLRAASAPVGVHRQCPICHALTSPVTGTTYHAPHCPNGLGQALAWAPSDVTADDARSMRH